MASSRATATAVLVEGTVAAGRHVRGIHDKDLGARSPFTAPIDEALAHRLRMIALSNAGQPALTRFDVERGMDEFLPTKLKHREAFLP